MIAPTNHAALSLRTAVARLGRSMINIEAVTPKGLARHIWKSISPTHASRFMTRAQGEYVLGVLSTELRNDSESLFRSSISTVYASIMMDKQSGRFLDGSDDASQHRQAYARLYDLYLSYLRSHDKLDEVDIHELALSSVSSFVEQRHLGVILICDEVELSVSEWNLINEIGARCKFTFRIGSGAEGLPEHTAQGRFLDWDYPDVAGAVEAPAVDSIVGSTRREEVRLVLEDVIGHGTPFDSIEIAYTSRDPYLVEIIAACTRFGIPWQTPDRSVGADSRLIGLIRMYARWVSEGYPTALLVRALRENLLDTSPPGIDSRNLAAALNAFPVGVEEARRDDLGGIIRKMARSRRIAAENVNAMISFLKEMSVFVLPDTLHPAEFGDGLANLVDTFGCHIPDSDHFRELWDAWFPHFADQNSPRASSNWIASCVLSGLKAHVLSGKVGVMILPLDEAGYAVSDRIYVVGLDDQSSSSVPNMAHSIVPADNAGIVESEMVSIRHKTAGLRRRSGTNLVLSASSYDVSSGRPLFPGSAFMELCGAHAFTPRQRNLWLDACDQLAAERNAEVLDLYPSLRSGNSALECRKSDLWTRYDGVVSTAEEPDVFNLSPSELEILADCPFRYFLSRVLRVSVAPDPDQKWISKREEGSLLHELFERHIRDRIEGNAGTGKADEAAVIRRLERNLDEIASVFGQALGAFLDHKKRELGTAVSLFFDRERELEPFRTPIAAEFSFGERDGDDAPPCLINLESRNLRLSGRVDRIDQQTDGSLIITDYKGGTFSGYAPADLKKFSDKLQWALYSFTTARFFGKQVETAEYFFTSAKGGGMVRSVAPPPDKIILDLLTDLTARIGEGAFVQSADGGSCMYCDFRDICGNVKERREEVTTKFLSVSDGLTPLFESWQYRTKMGGI